MHPNQNNNYYGVDCSAQGIDKGDDIAFLVSSEEGLVLAYGEEFQCTLGTDDQDQHPHGQRADTLLLNEGGIDKCSNQNQPGENQAGVII